MAICVGILLSAYGEYRLCHVPPDIIGFTRELGIAMEVALGSGANVLEVLVLLDIMQSNRFADLPESWSDRTLRSIDYHPIRATADGGYFY